MIKLKCIFIIIIILASTRTAMALDIQYGSIRDYKNSSVLIEYYGLGKKTNYICNILNSKCIPTKKMNLGIKNNISTAINPSIIKEMEDKKANRLTISKSGGWIAYYIKADGKNNERTYTIKNIKDNKNYTTSSSVTYWDLVNEQMKVFEFSPDEKTLIYLDDKDGFASIYKVNLDSLQNEKIESIKIRSEALNISDFIYTDPDNLYYVGNSKENPYKWSLYHMDLRTEKESVIESYVSYLDRIIKINNSLIFNRLQSKGYGPEVYNLKTKKINTFKIPNIGTKINTKNEQYIKIDDMNAVVMTPSVYNPKKTYKALIWLHGGPLRQASYIYHPYHSYGIYDSMLKLLQKNNVIVLKLDYRGSLGSGRNYSEKIKGSVGSGDIEDVMKTVSYLKNNYNVGDIYLSGNSYGGYMSLKALVEHPETFKGVFSMNGVTDWESLLKAMKTSIFNTEFGGAPSTINQDLYNQASIINKIGNLGNQRIEIIQGGSDRTIPPWQSVLLYKKLKEAGKNVNLVTYSKEDHVFKEKKNIGDICSRLLKSVGIKNTKECKN